MTNKDIRRRAWELCRENFWTILGASFLISLISTLLVNIGYYSESSVLMLIAEIALGVISTIVTLGMVRFILDIWHGQPTSLAVLFSQKKRFWTSVCSGLLVGLIGVGIMLPFIILIVAAVFISESLGGVVAVIAIIAACVLMLWIALRYEMVTACIVLRPSCGATDCMRAAWRASKGNVGRLFCNAFVLNLPLAAAQILLTGYQTFLAMNGQTLNGFGSIVLDVASMLISALLTGYIALGTYALHEHLLENHFRSNPETWNSAPTSYSLTPEELGLGDPIELPAPEDPAAPTDNDPNHP